MMCSLEEDPRICSIPNLTQLVRLRVWSELRRRLPPRQGAGALRGAARAVRKDAGAAVKVELHAAAVRSAVYASDPGPWNPQLLQ